MEQNHSQGVVVDQFSADEALTEPTNGRHARSEAAATNGHHAPPAARSPAATNGHAGHGRSDAASVPARSPDGLDDPDADPIAHFSTSSELAIAPQFNRPSRSRPSRRSGLNLTLLAGCVGAVTMLVLGGALVGLARHRLLAQAQQQQSQATIALADRTQQFLASRQREAILLGTGSPLTSPVFWQLATTTADRQATLNQLQRQLQVYDHMALLDLQGNVMLQSPASAALAAGVENRPYLQQAIATEQATLGIDPGTANQPAAIAIAVPLEQNGTFATVLHVRIDPTALQEPITSVTDAAVSAPTGYIVSGDGVVIGAASPTDIGRPITRLTNVSLGELVSSSRLALMTEGQDWLVSYAPVTLESAPAVVLGAIVRQSPADFGGLQSPLGAGLAIATGLAALVAGGTMAWSLHRHERPLRLATQTLLTWTPAGNEARPDAAEARLPVMDAPAWAIFRTQLHHWLDVMAAQLTTQRHALQQSQQETDAALRRAQATQARLEHVLLEHQAREATYQAQVAHQQHQLDQQQGYLRQLHQGVQGISGAAAQPPLPDTWGEIAAAYQASHDRWHRLAAQVRAVLPQMVQPLQQEVTTWTTAVAPPIALTPLDQLVQLQAALQANTAQTQQVQTTLAAATTQLDTSATLAISSLDTVRLLQRAIATEQQSMQQIQAQLEQVTTTVAQLDRQLGQATLSTFNASLKAARVSTAGRPLTPLLHELRSLQQDSTSLTTKLIALLATVTPDVRTLASHLRTLEPLLRQLDTLPALQTTLMTMQQSHQELQAAIAHLTTEQAAQLQTAEQVLPLVTDWVTQLRQTQARTTHLTTTLQGVLQLAQTLQQEVDGGASGSAPRSR